MVGQGIKAQSSNHNSSVVPSLLHAPRHGNRSSKLRMLRSYGTKCLVYTLAAWFGGKRTAMWIELGICTIQVQFLRTNLYLGAPFSKSTMAWLASAIGLSLIQG